MRYMYIGTRPLHLHTSVDHNMLLCFIQAVIQRAGTVIGLN